MYKENVVEERENRSKVDEEMRKDKEFDQLSKFWTVPLATGYLCTRANFLEYEIFGCEEHGRALWHCGTMPNI